jgi:hypothetical protein
VRVSRRELLPRSVYLPADAIAELDRRAAEGSVAVGTLRRQILAWARRLGGTRAFVLDVQSHPDTPHL